MPPFFEDNAVIFCAAASAAFIAFVFRRYSPRLQSAELPRHFFAWLQVISPPPDTSARPVSFADAFMHFDTPSLLFCDDYIADSAGFIRRRAHFTATIIFAARGISSPTASGFADLKTPTFMPPVFCQPESSPQIFFATADTPLQFSMPAATPSRCFSR